MYIYGFNSFIGLCASSAPRDTQYERSQILIHHAHHCIGSAQCQREGTYGTTTWHQKSTPIPPPNPTNRPLGVVEWRLLLLNSVTGYTSVGQWLWLDTILGAFCSFWAAVLWEIMELSCVIRLWNVKVALFNITRQCCHFYSVIPHFFCWNSW